MTPITKVTATRLFKKDGREKGWLYTAHVGVYADIDDDQPIGTAPVRLRLARRLYEFAYQYEAEVQGNASPGLSQHFCFGKRPPQGLGTPIQTFTIERTS